MAFPSRVFPARAHPVTDGIPVIELRRGVADRANDVGEGFVAVGPARHGKSVFRHHLQVRKRLTAPVDRRATGRE
jgi:hypothetical protein